jgi:predicted house-cleaning noncanonical NTP pyrophosphatase (MazG superfamily)
MIKKYEKLVRDKMPEIIKANGQTSNTRILGDADFRRAVADKVVEEAQEVREALLAGGGADFVKEVGDLREIVAAAIELDGADEKQITEVQKLRCEQRGGFDKRIFLIDVEEAENA